MSFKDVKNRILECLDSGQVLHEARGDIDTKNLLSTGAVSLSDVTTIIGRARGNSYCNSPHHFDAEIDVHVIKTTYSGQRWYIKWYFIEPDCVFISVHD